MLFSTLLPLLAAATAVAGASLQQVTSFGTNPTKINMYIYVPDKLATKPAVIVAVSRPRLRLKLQSLRLSSCIHVVVLANSGTAVPSCPRTLTQTASFSSIHRLPITATVGTFTSRRHSHTMAVETPSASSVWSIIRSASTVAMHRRSSLWAGLREP
jgi:hypothetical protein